MAARRPKTVGETIRYTTHDTPDEPLSRLFVVARLHHQALYSLFSSYGTVEYITVHIDSTTRESAGFNYVKFSTEEEARRAKEQLHGQVTPEQPRKPLKVLYSDDPHRRDEPIAPVQQSSGDQAKDRLFCVVSRSLTEDEFRDCFASYPGVNNVQLLRGKGVGYVRFDTHSQAQYALDTILTLPTSAGKIIKALWATERSSAPRTAPLEEAVYSPRPGLSELRLFYVVPRVATSDDLYALFSRYPGLLNVDLKTNSAGESKGFGYVTFDNYASVQKALEDYGQDTTWLGGRFKVEEAVPTEKSRAAAAAAGVTPSPIPGLVHVVPSEISQQKLPTLFPNIPRRAVGSLEEPQGSRLYVIVSPHNDLTEDVLIALFHLIPGLEYFEMKEGKDFGFAKYQTVEQADSAVELLNLRPVTNSTFLKVRKANPAKRQSDDTILPAAKRFHDYTDSQMSVQ